MTGNKIVFSSFLLLLFNISVGLCQAPNITYATPQKYTINVPVATLTPTNTGGAVPATTYGQTATFAGSSTVQGSTDGQGTAASFYAPAGLATDAAGNVYVADEGGNTIRKITPQGLVTTIAGSGVAGNDNGIGTTATFNGPTGVVVDAAGDVFVADYNNNEIREISYAGVVTTFAGSGTAGIDDGTGTAATFDRPEGLTIDAAGDIYVADYGRREIRKITPAGVVTTIASNGNPIFYPTSVTVDATGNIYFTDQVGNTIRKITPAGVVSIFAGSYGTAGNADGTNATFNYPTGVTTDNLGNIYVADQDNYSIRKITPAGVVSTLAGGGPQGNQDGVGQAAEFFSPTGVAIDNAGNLFVADLSNNEIREITLTGYAIDKPLPAGLTFDATTGKISGTPTAVSPSTNYTITAYNGSGSSSTVLNITVTGVNPPPVAPKISYQTPQTYVINQAIPSLAPSNSGGAVPPGNYNTVSTFAGSGATGSADGVGTAASFNIPTGITTDAAGNFVVSDYGNQVIRSITPGGAVTTIAGNGTAGLINGPATNAEFHYPFGVVVDAANSIYVSDQGNRVIRKITANGAVTTFSGNGFNGETDGSSTAANYDFPAGMAITSGGIIYEAEDHDNTIRQIMPDGSVKTIAGNGTIGAKDGTGTAATFNEIAGLAINSNGNIYAGDSGNKRIRIITPAGVVSTLTFTSTVQGPGGGLTTPSGLAFDALGNLYIADMQDNRIKEISTAGVLTDVAGTGGAGAANGPTTSATFNQPGYLTFDANGNLFVTEEGNNLVREIDLTGYTIDKTLPAGLTFDPKTGIISGTPTVLSPPTNYTVTAYNAGGNSTTVVNIQVVNAVTAPKISYATPQVFTQNTAITPVSPTNAGGPVAAGGYSSDVPLPAGLSLDATTGIISGTPAVTGTTTVNITATNAGGASTATISIAVNGLSTITFNAIPAKTICDADFSPGAKASDNSTITYTSDNPAVATIVNNRIHITGAGTANITATSANGATAMQTLTVTTGVTPTIAISPVAVNACIGVPITFTAAITNGGKAPIYQWKVNGQNQGPNNKQFVASSLADGDKVTCTLTSNATCAITDTVTSNTASFSGSASSNTYVTITSSAVGPVCAGSQVTFFASALTTDTEPSYQWQVNGVDTGPNNPTFVISNLNDGDVVTCLVNSVGSCIINPTALSNAITVTVSKGSGCNVFVNNAFTPNGDGINDTWDLPFLTGYPGCSVSIYNRYGALVYHSIGYAVAWDGTYKGTALPVGTYYYVIDLKNGSKPVAGPITIIR